MSAGLVRSFKQSGQILLSFGNGIPFSATLENRKEISRHIYFVSKFCDLNSINKCNHLNLTLGAGGGGGAGYMVGAVTLSSAD